MFLRCEPGQEGLVQDRDVGLFESGDGEDVHRRLRRDTFVQEVLHRTFQVCGAAAGWGREFPQLLTDHLIERNLFRVGPTFGQVTDQAKGLGQAVLFGQEHFAGCFIGQRAVAQAGQVFQIHR